MAPLVFLELTLCKKCAAELEPGISWNFYLGEAAKFELKQVFYVAFLEALARLKKEDATMKKLIDQTLRGREPVN